MARTIRDDVREIFGDVEPDWARYARFVIDRRTAMGLTQEQIAAMPGGPSTASLRVIEAASQDNYRASTLMGLDKVLGWTPDSHRAILAGREPRELFPAEDYRRQLLADVESVGGDLQDDPVLRRDPDIERALRSLRRVGEDNARNASDLNDALAALAQALGQDE